MTARRPARPARVEKKKTGDEEGSVAAFSRNDVRLCERGATADECRQKEQAKESALEENSTGRGKPRFSPLPLRWALVGCGVMRAYFPPTLRSSSSSRLRHHGRAAGGGGGCLHAGRFLLGLRSACSVCRFACTCARVTMSSRVTCFSFFSTTPFH